MRFFANEWGFKPDSYMGCIQSYVYIIKLHLSSSSHCTLANSFPEPKNILNVYSDIIINYTNILSTPSKLANKSCYKTKKNVNILKDFQRPYQVIMISVFHIPNKGHMSQSHPSKTWKGKKYSLYKGYQGQVLFCIFFNDQDVVIPLVWSW